MTVPFATRRVLLVGAASLVATSVCATPEQRDAAIKAFTNGAPIQQGRVRLDIPPLVENGNSVPTTIAVESPMTDADFVKRIGLFNERNPQPEIAVFHLTPRAGRAMVSTRIRLGDSQTIFAVAEMSDGSFWSGSVELVVTLPACAET